MTEEQRKSVLERELDSFRSEFSAAEAKFSSTNYDLSRFNYVKPERNEQKKFNNDGGKKIKSIETLLTKSENLLEKVVTFEGDHGFEKAGDLLDQVEQLLNQAKYIFKETVGPTLNSMTSCYQHLERQEKIEEQKASVREKNQADIESRRELERQEKTRPEEEIGATVADEAKEPWSIFSIFKRNKKAKIPYEGDDRANISSESLETIFDERIKNECPSIRTIFSDLFNGNKDNIDNTSKDLSSLSLNEVEDRFTDEVLGIRREIHKIARDDVVSIKILKEKYSKNEIAGDVYTKRYKEIVKVMAKKVEDLQCRLDVLEYAFLKENRDNPAVIHECFNERKGLLNEAMRDILKRNEANTQTDYKNVVVRPRRLDEIDDDYKNACNRFVRFEESLKAVSRHYDMSRIANPQVGKFFGLVL